MATTTPNFGWTVPTSSDLVKNGATAIETLGDSIDASLVDLKGGTTNQVLAKNSNTDMDFKWVADASGIPATILDAKGDLIAASAADTAARLAVGTNGQVLTADSAETTGLKWATPSGSSGPAFRAFRDTSTQTIAASNTWTKVQFNGETFDTDSCFDSTTNYRFTPTTAGYYQINLNVYNSLTGNPSYVLCAIYKNGSSYSKSEVMINGQNFAPAQVSDIVYLNGTTDYIEGYALQQLNSTITNGSDITNFSGTWIRS
jgi:hypothetical protein